jgi:hypothetical protein
VVGVVGVDPAVVVAARRDKIERSDICNRCATGGIRARVAGRRLTSDFMSDKSSSSWFRTYIQKSMSKKHSSTSNKLTSSNVHTAHKRLLQWFSGGTWWCSCSGMALQVGRLWAIPRESQGLSIN